MTRLGRSPYPEFFIVGAPRCGTTFLHQSLSEHPQVFMPKLKEPHFFSNDLDRGTYGDGQMFIRSEAEYLAMFEDARPDQVRGEADVMNLFSPSAARRIRAARPDARIVISLRDPVEHLRSYHGVRYRVGHEGLKLPQALDAAADRAAGRRLPWLARNLPMYDYRAVSRFSEQVSRYVDTFPAEQLLILLLDEIAGDADRTYARVLAHVGVDDSFPLPELGVVNESRGIRSRALLNAIRWPRLIETGKAVVPRRLHPVSRRLVIRIGDWNQPQREMGWTDHELRRSLRSEYAPEVERLGRLIGRDLTRLWGYDGA